MWRNTRANMTSSKFWALETIGGAPTRERNSHGIFVAESGDAPETHRHTCKPKSSHVCSSAALAPAAFASRYAGSSMRSTAERTVSTETASSFSTPRSRFSTLGMILVAITGTPSQRLSTAGRPKPSTELTAIVAQAWESARPTSPSSSPSWNAKFSQARSSSRILSIKSAGAQAHWPMNASRNGQSSFSRSLSHASRITLWFFRGSIVPRATNSGLSEP